MFDFPNSPTLNQTITGPGGIQYRWDGAKWVSGTTPSSYLPLTGGTVSGNLTVTGTATLPNAVAEPALNNVGRSYIHNGLMNIQQRGAGPWTLAAPGYTADRWLLLGNTDTVSVSVIALSDADRTAIGDEAALFALQDVFTGSAAGGAYHQIRQRIENIRRLSGKTLIVSFWARASVGTPMLSLYWTQVFGAGGSPSATTSGAIGNTPALSTAWTRYSLSFAYPSTVGKTFGTTAGTDYGELAFQYSAQTGPIQSGTVQIWGVQLEVAQPGQTLPTPLEKIPYDDDMRHCMRFYSILTHCLFPSYGTAGINVLVSLTFPVPMRATPTTNGANIALTNCSNLVMAAASPFDFYAQFNVTATGLGYLYADVVATADL